jgi:hypothetical protein
MALAAELPAARVAAESFMAGLLHVHSRVTVRPRADTRHRVARAEYTPERSAATITAENRGAIHPVDDPASAVAVAFTAVAEATPGAAVAKRSQDERTQTVKLTISELSVSSESKVR